MTKKNKFTLIELLIVITIIAILVAILLPALGLARFKTGTIVDLSDQKQWGMRLILHATDNDAIFYNEPNPGGNPSIHDINESFETTFAKYAANDVSFFFCHFREPAYSDAAWLEGSSGSVDHMGFGYWVERDNMTAKDQGAGSYAPVSENSSDDLLWSDNSWAPTSNVGSFPAGVFNNTWATRHEYGGRMRNMNAVYADGHGITIDRSDMAQRYVVQSVIWFYADE